MSKITQLNISCCSHIGKRTDNEDDFYCDGLYVNSDRFSGVKGIVSFDVASSTEGVHLFAVCDGMGGESLGELASATAVRCIAAHHRDLSNHEISSTDPSFIVYNLYEKANQSVVDKSDKHKVSRMGTTIALACIRDNMLNCSNVGDSKVFLYRNHELSMLTVDDNLAYDLFRRKKISEEELYSHPGRSQLLQYIGMRESESPLIPHFSDSFPLEVGDVVIICSDGVTDGVNKRTLIDEIDFSIAHESSTSIAKRIAEKAYECGSNDNITAIAVQCR